MGKASKSKRLRRAAQTLPTRSAELGASLCISPKPAKPDGPVPMARSEPKFSRWLQTVDRSGQIGQVFRFFKERQHAEDFVEGKIWISTLETCRAYEAAKQGDAEEARHVRDIGDSPISGNDPLAQKIFHPGAAIHFQPGARSGTIRNFRIIEQIPDALVLCATMEFDPEALSETFGRFCVEIQDPNKVFVHITNALFCRYPMMADGRAAPVIYSERHVFGLQEIPAPLGFVKPADIYSEQKEFRMLWNVDQTVRLTPGVLEVPQVAKYCRIIE